MEGSKLNLYSPLPSIRRISSKTKHSSESNNKKTIITRPELRSCLSKEQETSVFVLSDQSFDHLSEPASVPFMWEHTPGKPKDDMATLIQESGLLETDDEEEEDLYTVSSDGTFSVNCSTSGVSDIEKNGEKSDDASSREISNRGLNHSREQTGLPNWSTRRLSGFMSPYRTSCSAPEKPESFKRLNIGISKSQELCPTRTRTREILPNHSHSGEVRMLRNSISTPPWIQGTTIHDTRFLAEEVIRRRRSSNRSGNLLKTSPKCTAAITTPPLPETPSRPWLRRTLLPPVSPRPYGVVLGQVGAKKLNQEIVESTKWETMVKTSYVHNDHVRYSQELTVHPSRQKIT
ncbi:hypothetical protein IGI04_012857 [Brassica rapa subsp. trilocularis]|uniref:Uncharacterized protein n=1 Tax=Brassica rapa subsp. trilocularis TaxID=1813537 RepID=A0ABQ7N7T1_BRACM|nr:hypothetical protein IGI04_012857 [Brassica rapa subsp. trilocularis]